VKFDAATLRELVIVLVPMILSLTVHEFAHAWSAFKLGDDTASRQGRMTLNPTAHIDPIGTLLIPIFSVLNGGISLIGWAKPVPVAPYRFKRTVSMRTGMMLTALAGPASNLLIAFVFSGIIMLKYGDAVQAVTQQFQVSRFMAVHALGGNDPIMMIFGRVFFLNLSLAVFNMLPVPPLDGSRILPPVWQEKMARYQMLVFVALLALINFGSSVLVMPISFVGNAMLAIFGIFV
jgi:Zn-dependent protease